MELGYILSIIFGILVIINETVGFIKRRKAKKETEAREENK